MARKAKKILSLKIIDVADKGKSIAKDEDGIVYLLDEGVPGDVVDFIYYRKYKGMRAGKVERYIKFSKDRVEPTCKHFGICGGCKWQHFSYTSQLRYKEKQVKDAIRRLAGLDDHLVQEILPAPEIFKYRNKLEYSFSENRWLTEEEIQSEQIIDKRVAGFHKAGMYNKIVDIQECWLQESTSNQIRNWIKAYGIEKEISFYNTVQHQGGLRNLIIRNSSIGEWMVVLVSGEKDERIQEMLEKLVQEFEVISSCYWVVNPKKNDTIYDLPLQLIHGKPTMEERLGDISYLIGPKSFFQTNSQQAKNMFDLVKKLADIKPDEIVYDLYSGIGSIALYIAQQAKKVIGIEEVAAAVDDAKVNMQMNGIENCRFYSGDVKDIVSEEFIQKEGAADLVITDPPRAGMHADVCRFLLGLKAKRIVYVSCNPSTQARDIKLLSSRYNLRSVTPVDLFPHTHHVESVALLTLKE